MGSIVSGLFGGGGDAGDAAQDAAAVQAKATEQAIAEQRRQFDITQEQFAPYLAAGDPALNQYMALLGLGGGAGTGGAPAQAGVQATTGALSYEDWAARQSGGYGAGISSLFGGVAPDEVAERPAFSDWLHEGGEGYGSYIQEYPDAGADVQYR